MELHHFWRGALDMEIIGEDAERFLNMALARGVDIGEIRRIDSEHMTVRVALADIYILREIAHPAHCRFRIKRRLGLPFAAVFVRRRPMLPLMAAAMIFLLCYLSSLIFFLDVTGPYELSQQQQQHILALAADAGVSPYHSRWSMDLAAAEKYILAEEKDLVFAEIRVHGVSVIIDIVYRVDVNEEDQSLPPGDIVADYDGVIRQILVRRGTALVAPGDIVHIGDVLVSGRVGELEQAASAIISADIWSEGYGECLLTFSGIKETGAVSDYVAVCVKGQTRLIISGAKDSPYQLFECREQANPLRVWRKMELPVEVISGCYYEQKHYTEKLSAAEAHDRAVDIAVNAAQSLLPEDAVIEDKKIIDISLDDGLQRVHVQLRVAYDIGRFREGLSVVDEPEEDLNATE